MNRHLQDALRSQSQTSTFRRDTWSMFFENKGGGCKDQRKTYHCRMSVASWGGFRYETCSSEKWLLMMRSDFQKQTGLESWNWRTFCCSSVICLCFFCCSAFLRYFKWNLAVSVLLVWLYLSIKPPWPGGRNGYWSVNAWATANCIWRPHQGVSCQRHGFLMCQFQPDIEAWADLFWDWLLQIASVCPSCEWSIWQKRIGHWYPPDDVLMIFDLAADWACQLHAPMAGWTVDREGPPENKKLRSRLLVLGKHFFGPRIGGILTCRNLHFEKTGLNFSWGRLGVSSGLLMSLETGAPFWFCLQAYELCRFKVAMAILKWSYTGEQQAWLAELLRT